MQWPHKNLAATERKLLQKGGPGLVLDNSFFGGLTFLRTFSSRTFFPLWSSILFCNNIYLLFWYHLVFDMGQVMNFTITLVYISFSSSHGVKDSWELDYQCTVSVSKGSLGSENLSKSGLKISGMWGWWHISCHWIRPHLEKHLTSCHPKLRLLVTAPPPWPSHIQCRGKD